MVLEQKEKHEVDKKVDDHRWDEMVGEKNQEDWINKFWRIYQILIEDLLDASVDRGLAILPMIEDIVL